MDATSLDHRPPVPPKAGPVAPLPEHGTEAPVRVHPKARARVLTAHTPTLRTKRTSFERGKLTSWSWRMKDSVGG